MYILARYPGEDPFKELGEKVLEGSFSDLLNEPVDELIILFGIGGSMIGAPLASGAAAMLAHLIVRYSKSFKKKKARAQFYGEFKRDFYQYVAQMEEKLGSELYERLASLAGLDEEAK